MKKIIKISLFSILASLLFGCTTTYKTVTVDVLDPVDIVLTEKEKHLAVGETYQIHASYVMEDSRDDSVAFEYHSLDTNVAIVSNSGLVEAVGIGEAIIQITYNQTKTLLKIIVEENDEQQLLAINIANESISLYQNDTFNFEYEARLNGKLIDLPATYYGYNTSLISIENNVITALGVGSTPVGIRVTYGDNVAEASFTVNILELSYYLSCNYQASQLIVGEEDLAITYSLNYGSTLVKSLSLSELECEVSDEEIASINGNAIHGIKKGYFNLEVSYNGSEVSNKITTTSSFRCREKYEVKNIDSSETIYVLDGEIINYTPVNSDPNLVFDAWIRNGAVFNEPVESDLRLGVRWKINEFNFAADVRGAKSIAPSEGPEVIDAVYYNDDDVYANGLKYDLSKNVHGDSATEDLVANIYLPKMDYRKTNKVSYNWKTNGYVTIDMNHWYAGAIALGGTIDITYDGQVLTQTITQTYDVVDPFSGTSYKNATRTLICNDLSVIEGNENLQSISYWAYSVITATSSIYLSNPSVTVSHDYLPYFRLGNYVGTLFSTDDPNAHYDVDYKKPTIMQTISEGDDTSEDYLYYYQDRQYNEDMGITHCRADYTLSIPAINFAKQDVDIIMPYFIDGGFYVGFAEDKVTTECTGQLRFQYNQITGLAIMICSENGEVLLTEICTDNDVINGNKGYQFPVCYSTFCFERGLKIYQPRFAGECTQHNFVVSTASIGKEVCTFCGETRNYANRLNEIDFTQETYGARGGRWDTNVQPTNKTMTYEVVSGGVEEEIYLPRINFKAFASIRFTLSGNVWDARVGLESGNYAFPYSASGAHTGTLIFTRNGEQINVLLECADGVNQSLTITDEDVAEGNKSFSLFMIADDAYRTITAELIALNESDACSHNYSASTDKLGVEVCSFCGDERDYKNNLSDIDFTQTTYGARGGRWDTSVQPTAKTMKYEVTAGNTENVINLPRINFKAFASVQFAVRCGSFAIEAGLQSGSYILPGSTNSSDPAHTGVLTFTMNGNQLEASLVCNETSQSQTIIITDLDVVNGNISANLYMYSINYAFQTITIELTTLN